MFAGWSTWAEGASLPSLGLSNKALGEDEVRPTVTDVMEMCEGQVDARPAHLLGNLVSVVFFVLLIILLTVPPTEDHLMQNTLWPEIHKLLVV